MPEKTTQSVTLKDAQTGELLATPPKWLAGVPIVTNMEQLVERSMQRTLQASTPGALFSDPDSVGLRDCVGKIITVTDVIGIMPSNIKGRESDYYLIFEAVVDKELTTLTTGSPYAGGRIVKAFHEGWLPRELRVLEMQSAQDPTRSSLWVSDVKRSPGTAAGEEPF